MFMEKSNISGKILVFYNLKTKYKLFFDCSRATLCYKDHFVAVSVHLLPL